MLLDERTDGRSSGSSSKRSAPASGCSGDGDARGRRAGGQGTEGHFFLEVIGVRGVGERSGGRESERDKAKTFFFFFSLSLSVLCLSPTALTLPTRFFPEENRRCQGKREARIQRTLRACMCTLPLLFLSYASPAPRSDFAPCGDEGERAREREKQVVIDVGRRRRPSLCIWPATRAPFLFSGGSPLCFSPALRDLSRSDRCIASRE